MWSQVSGVSRSGRFVARFGAGKRLEAQKVIDPFEEPLGNALAVSRIEEATTLDRVGEIPHLGQGGGEPCVAHVEFL